MSSALMIEAKVPGNNAIVEGAPVGSFKSKSTRAGENNGVQWEVGPGTPAGKSGHPGH